MILKFNRIIILFIAFNIITSCNPDICYLEDCTNFEKIKNSILTSFGNRMLEQYRYVDSLDWFFIETDTTYDIEYYVKEELALGDNIIDDGRHVIIQKKNCKATYYSYKHGKYGRY